MYTTFTALLQSPDLQYTATHKSSKWDRPGGQKTTRCEVEG